MSLLPRYFVYLCCADEDAELEKRLEKLRLAKGATPYGQGTKAQAKQQAAGQPSTSSKPAGKLSCAD